MDGGHDVARRRMEVYTELQTAAEPQWRVHVFHFTGWKPWDQPERGGVYVDDAGQVSARAPSISHTLISLILRLCPACLLCQCPSSSP